jgi:hypothetical protein
LGRNDRFEQYERSAFTDRRFRPTVTTDQLTPMIAIHVAEKLRAVRTLWFFGNNRSHSF